MPKKYVIPAQSVEWIGIYRLTLSVRGDEVIFENEDATAEGEFRISEERAKAIFTKGSDPIYVVGYLDEDGVLQIFPDIEIEDCYW